MLLCFIVVILDVILIHILHLLDKILKDYNEIGHIRFTMEDMPKISFKIYENHNTSRSIISKEQSKSLYKRPDKFKRLITSYKSYV